MPMGHDSSNIVDKYIYIGSQQAEQVHSFSTRQGRSSTEVSYICLDFVLYQRIPMQFPDPDCGKILFQ